MVSVIFDYKRR